jgi:hypothetical protein
VLVDIGIEYSDVSVDRLLDQRHQVTEWLETEAMVLPESLRSGPAFGFRAHPIAAMA